MTYLSPVYRNGVLIGYHTVVVAGDNGKYVRYDGGGAATGQLPTPKRDDTLHSLPTQYGDGYAVNSPYKTGADEIAALDNAFNGLTQLPYNVLGPNSNTYAHELLDIAGMTLPEYTTTVVHGAGGFTYPSEQPVGPAATIGWNTGGYAKDKRKQCSR